MASEPAGLIAEVADYLACPSCGAALRSYDDSLLCVGCRARAVLYTGVVSFSTDDNLSYIEYVDRLSSSEFAQFVHIAATEGVDCATRYLESLGDRGLNFQGYLLGVGRADWRFQLDLPRDACILDIGCGWGSISFELLQEYGRVFSVDASLGKLTFLRQRAAQAGLYNLIPIAASIGRRFPFQPRLFDLVILNGVLEWVGKYADTSRPVEDVQVDWLSESYRVLKERGILYIGIENRFGYEYFLGRRDEHSGERFTSIVPRPVADCIMRSRGKHCYRTYTYSLRSWRRMLTTAGFSRVEFLAPFPNYREMYHIVPLNHGPCLPFYYRVRNPQTNRWASLLYGLTEATYRPSRRRLISALSSIFLRLLSHLSPVTLEQVVPSFGIAAYKGTG